MPAACPAQVDLVLHPLKSELNFPIGSFEMRPDVMTLKIRIRDWDVDMQQVQAVINVFSVLKLRPCNSEKSQNVNFSSGMTWVVNAGIWQCIF